MRLLIVIFLVSIPMLGQTQGAGTVDTIGLSLKEILEQAKVYHPIIRQAQLQDHFAEAQLTSAKGMLDPKIESGYNLKAFKETEYYNKFHNSLKIPVWFPIDPKIEAYRNSGEWLSNENYVSSTTDYWQFTAGVSLPIGKGLLIDERRSIIKQARLYGNIAESERIKLTNKVMLDIVKAYWEWYFAYEQFKLLQQSLSISRELFDRVKIDHQFGEASVVDTIQAKITYQNRLADYTNARLALTNSRLALSIHLWKENDIPLEITPNTIPKDNEELWIVPADSSMGTLINWALEKHPEIQKLHAKQKQLKIEEMWNKESLKPELNISYSLIDAPINIDGLESPDFYDNYKLGMNFSFPIFLRKERGKLQKTRLYQESNAFELIQTQQKVAAEINATYAELRTSQELSVQYQQLAQNYSRLFQAELLNVENGESDLFKLNIQQDKYIESQIKYLKAQVKFEKLKAHLPYIAGLPYLSYLKLYE